jgi:hypothetical protein
VPAGRRAHATWVMGVECCGGILKDWAGFVDVVLDVPEVEDPFAQPFQGERQEPCDERAPA